MIDIAIVGAGTAGMTAAIYARRAGMDVSVFEGNTYGGQIVATPEVENYPGYEKISGFDLADSIFRQATALDAKFVFDQINKVEKTETGFVLKGDFGDYEARTVIIATGATNRHLGIDKEAELTGRGISYCATCDGAFFKDKVHPMTTILHFSVVSGALCIPFFITSLKPLPLREILILFAIAFTGNLWVVGLTMAFKLAPASEVSIYEQLSIVSSLALGWIFLHQVPGINTLVGGAIVITASVLIYFYNRRHHRLEQAKIEN